MPTDPRQTGRAPMPVKHWSRAGLMLTDWCNATCACCYANCGPAGRTWMPPADAIAIWRSLAEASPHGCRVHLTGGEVFGRFDYLLELCLAARREGLAPLEAIETNGYWAEDAADVRQRLEALDAAGMGRLTVSTDPYHQQYVPIDRVRLLVRIAERILGPDRVRVRFRDWLTDGFDLAEMPQAQAAEVLTRYAAAGRDRLTGRAAEGLDGRMPLKRAAEFDDKPCRERLLRGRHVHIAPTGEVWPATCVGIVVGNALDRPARDIWADLYARYDRLDVVGELSRRGPVGLLAAAEACGFIPRPEGYAGKCQLCFHLRRRLHRRGVYAAALGPANVYAGAADEN